MKPTLILFPLLLFYNMLVAQPAKIESNYHAMSIKPRNSNQVENSRYKNEKRESAYLTRQKETVEKQIETVRKGLIQEIEEKNNHYLSGNTLLKSATATKVLESDSLALVALYHSTDGPNWTNNTNWLTGKVSTWFGIYIIADRVFNVLLDNNNLIGYIPAEIGQLTGLFNLYLSNNQLTGSIPAELGQLTSLLTLSLYNNHLSGPLPPELGQLTKCNIFFLFNNQFSGPIPPEFGQLSELTLMYLQNNQLSSSIPAALGKLTKLHHLMLENNNLTGEIPGNLGQMTSLKALLLSDNQLTGQIPAELGQLSNLTLLELSANQLTGPIPPEIGQLSSLGALILNRNQLSDTIPIEISQLQELYYLYLYENQLTGAIPAELGFLQNLEELNLSINQLTGSIPAKLGQLSNLTGLSLSFNQLTGSIPDSLGELSNLQFLFLNNNQLSGIIPPELGQLINLTELDLAGNQLSGSVPGELAQLKNLRSFLLEDNLLSGSLPPGIAKMDSLRFICFQHNLLDEIPDFSDLDSLTKLYVFNNKLSFEDLEYNMDLSPGVDFIYSPQDSIGENEKYTKNNGENFIYTLRTGGENNKYQWFRNGVKLNTQTLASLTLSNLNNYDSGKYFCEITNSEVPGLNLTSRITTLEVTGSTDFCKYLIFNPGWNIFSIPGSIQLGPEELFEPLINNNSLVKIQDEEGNSLENWGLFGGWQDNIGTIAPTEGYKIKVTKIDSLLVCTVPFGFPYPIALEPGWNIMGYPQSEPYDAQIVVQKLIDKKTLLKVQDEKGNSIENWGLFGGWTNNIGKFEPGKGFKIKLSVKDTLWIYQNYPKSSAVVLQPVATTHFTPEFEGNGVDHMNLNLVDLPINFFNAGDELAIFDGTTCAGAVTIIPHHLQSKMVSIAASATDNQGMAGFAEGNPMTLKLWNSLNNQEFNLEPEIVIGTSIFTKHETIVASLAKYAKTGLEGIPGSKITEINCYPNPFSDKVTVEINLVTDANVQVEVLNQLGQRVKMITTKQLFPSGLHKLTWGGRNAGNGEAAPGIYHLRIGIDDSIVHRKIVLSK